jgi:hypothetical protein
MDNETREAVKKLSAKLVVIESIVKTMVVENLLETDDPIANLRDYAGRIEQSLVTAIPMLAQTRAAMLIQAECAEIFAAVEKWLRQAGAQ